MIEENMATVACFAANICRITAIAGWSQNI